MNSREFRKLYNSPLMMDDYAQRYDITKLEAMLYNDEQVARASLDDCRALYTFIIRGEKFCEGYIERAIEDGRLDAIMRRLDAIRKEV